MKTLEQTSFINDNISDNQLQSFKSAFVVPIGFPCINCKENILNVGDLYDLIDFLDNGEIFVRTVRFLNAYLQGYKLTIVVLDLNAGELVTRYHRMNIQTLPCSWLLMDSNVFNPKSKSDKEVTNDYCEKF